MASDKDFNDSTFASGPVGNDLYDKAREAIVAGLSAAASQYIEMDKDTINPNKTEKSLHGEDKAAQTSMSK